MNPNALRKTSQQHETTQMNDFIPPQPWDDDEEELPFSLSSTDLKDRTIISILAAAQEIPSEERGLALLILKAIATWGTMRGTAA
jgi:hypothetical protein